MDHIARFNRRKEILKEKERRHGLTIAADPALVDAFLQSPVDFGSVERGTSAFTDWWNLEVEVSDQEVKELLGSIKEKYDADKFDDLFVACKERVFSALVGPFGIGGLIAHMDKNGGNVTTIYNAQQKIYAEDKDAYRREDYTQKRNSNGQSFERGGPQSVGSQFTRSRLDAVGHLPDAYTGKRVQGDTTSPDHIVSCSEAHKNGMFMCSDQKKADFATDMDNLACTGRSINQSMRDLDKVEWAARIQGDRSETNAAHFGVEMELLKSQYQKAKAAAERHLPSTGDKARYYGLNTTGTGAREGVKMGIQQGLGLLLSEFYQATFDEIMDIYKNGFAGGFDCDGFFVVLKERLCRVGKRLAERWKDVCDAFTSGFLSGFISNLVTTVINTFYTTSKRVVRMIREGFFSLLKALRMLVDPPEGVTRREAAHEATKIVASGLVVTVGVLVEQKLAEFLGALPFSELVTSALVGGITGIATTFVVYIIDKIDLFRVNAREEHRFIMQKLETDIDTMIVNAESILLELDQPALITL